ncbi:DUF1542 domain-containing protein [Limosilactobacillus reuteri]|uniref:DUF1542 domain-containing protein n=1 Tax=Limosilactobacillus reuteri TaxID=1598 RepID=UPI00177F347E|nr:DUF1542 domain-containing protein [Limosilactobacillus reuteri]
MVSKNNHQFYQQKHAERKQRWGIRKLSVGVASVLLGTTFMLYGNHAVLADTVPTTTPTDATVQTDSNVADHQGSEVPLRTTADKDKQTNANETTQNTTNVDKKDTEVTPTNDATTATPKTTAKVNAPVAPTAMKAVVNPTSTDPTTSNNEEASTSLPWYSFSLVTTSNNEEASTSLPMSNQDIKLDSQPMLTEIINKPKDNWVYNNTNWYNSNYSTAKVKEILQNHTTNDESGRYYFGGVANYNESVHVIYLLARSNNLNDNKLYVTILHTGTGNIQEEVVAPGESKKVEYNRTGGTTHAPIFTNYDGTSVSIDLDGIEKGNNIYGMVVGFAYGSDTGIHGDPASMGNGFMTTPMPTKTTTTIHYIDQATGDELAVPKSFEGVAYQKYTITGEAPTIDGYTLKQSPKTTGHISPYKVGESYDFRLDKHVVVKQTVIDSQGFVRVTAYYDGEAINNTTRYLGNKLNVNDHYSFVSHGKSYTYINQITSTNDGIVYYYAKDGSEDKSEVRVHYIDVTGNKNSIFVPGDGEEVATDKISGKLGENYNYNVNLPTDYNLATNQANTVNGTYTIDHHDEYVYVVEKTSAELDPTVKDKTKVDDPKKLTNDEKKEVEDNIRANNPGLPENTKIDVGDNGDTTITYPDKSVDTITGDKLVEEKTSAELDPTVKDKTKVDDPKKLTNDEKKEVEDNIRANNPGLPENTKIDVGDNGDTTITYPDKSVDTITGDKLVEEKTSPDTSATKDAAKNAIDQAAQAKNDAIEKSKLTDEEKAALQQTVAAEGQKAKDNIDAATKDADVKTAQTTGEEAINNINVPAASAAKDAAKNAIDQAAKTKNDAIEKSKLTDEEKAALQQTVADEVTKAKAAIDAAKKADDVTTAKNTGVGKINNINVPTTSATKDAAKNAIDQAAKAKNDAIDASNLTAEEKADLKKQVAGEVQKAKSNIDAATKDTDVKTAQTTGEKAINNINVPDTSATKDAAKDAAKNAIDQAAKTKDDAIDASNLTAEEKDALKQKVAEEVQKAKGNIDAATKDTDVKTAQTTGEKAINNINVPDTSATKDAAKDAAKNAIDQAAKTKDDAIDASNLTAEEKDALKQKVAEEVQKAKGNIDAATKDADVKTAQTNGEKAINAVEIPTSSKTKNDANSDLDNTADAAKKAIDETSGLTDDQKQTAKDQIDTAVGDAQENIKKASDNQGVADAKDAGKLAIDKVSAKAAIDAALNNKKSAIAKAPLTAEEAKPLNDLVDQEADAAKAAIDDATTNAVVEAAKNNGVEKINNINVPTTSATKDAANKAIENALAKKIEEIKANTNLTDDQKQSLIDQAQNAANQAKENVRSASTNEDVQTAKNNGIAAINGITVKSNSVDDQDNSATNEGNGNQAGHIQSDNSSDVTKHSSIQQSGNEKTQLPQTGNETQRGAGLVGLAIAGLVGLLGSAGFRKKRD